MRTWSLIITGWCLHELADFGDRVIRRIRKDRASTKKGLWGPGT